ncbi:hypothetical protein [Streptomyces sp. NPDC088727]|uniref:hypothetical protein n=1 Tax=Streptomyces sp. NPDC088727 TaxID=3365875 RepID=UPI0038162D98
MPDAADPKVIFAWCFSHGRLHIFTTEAEPWCTALWTSLAGADRDEALRDKQERFGDAVFEGQLSQEQRVRLILGAVNQHETHLLGHATALHESERWMAERGVDWGPGNWSDATSRLGIYATDNGIRTKSLDWAWLVSESLGARLAYPSRLPLLLVAQIGDTLCWDGTRVWLHTSEQQGVETCITKEADMQKFGTGTVLSALTQDTEEGRIVRTAVALTEVQREDIIDEGENVETEEK